MASRPAAPALDAAVLARIDGFVSATRTAVFVRRADDLLLIRPEKTLGVNPTAAAVLAGLYARGAGPAAEVLTRLAPELRTDPATLVRDAAALLETVSALMRDDFAPRPGLRFGHFDRARVRYPVLAEIALTYACQNRCAFCYAASPQRARRGKLMTTAEVVTVMERIFHEAHVPSLSFTGGEATLREDLPELVRRGEEIGFRVNLITNGLRAGEAAYARTLVEAGLASAQVSLEAPSAAVHDDIVGRPGAFALTTAAVGNLASLGIHVHTNTTLCRANLHLAEDVVRFVSRDLGRRTLSMNMLIRTGRALGPEVEPVRYAEIAGRLPAILEAARQEGVRLVWYSPLPYCLANPVLLGQGAKACACVDGILSVDPSGQVLPCSSFDRGLGSLLEQSYETIRGGPKARYWRERQYLPPACRGCPDADVCGGACPLYWDAAGSFEELPREAAADAAARRRWEEERRRGGSFGVPLPGREDDATPASEVPWAV